MPLGDQYFCIGMTFTVCIISFKWCDWPVVVQLWKTTEREWPQSLSMCVSILQGIYRQGINNMGYQSDAPALCVGVSVCRTHLALTHMSSIQASRVFWCVCVMMVSLFCELRLLASAETFWFLDWHKWDYIELITAVRCWIQLYDIHTVLFRMCSMMCVFHEVGML